MVARYLLHKNAYTGEVCRARRRDSPDHVQVWLRVLVRVAIDSDEFLKVGPTSWSIFADESDDRVLTAFLWFGEPQSPEPHVKMQVVQGWWRPRLNSSYEQGIVSVPVRAVLEVDDLVRDIAWAWLEGQSTTRHRSKLFYSVFSFFGADHQG